MSESTPLTFDIDLEDELKDSSTEGSVRLYKTTSSLRTLRSTPVIIISIALNFVFFIIFLALWFNGKHTDMYNTTENETKVNFSPFGKSSTLCVFLFSLSLSQLPLTSDDLFG
jgi:hypothetical protein